MASRIPDASRGACIEAAGAFDARKPGVEVLQDAAFGDRRWITLALPGDRCTVALELAQVPDDLAVIGRQANSFPLMAFDTADCVGDYQALKARGVTIHGEPETGPWRTGVLLEDLYGNKLFLSQEAGRPETASGPAKADAPSLGAVRPTGPEPAPCVGSVGSRAAHARP